MAVQQVLEGAAQAVRSAFGEGTEVYAGRVEQGAQQPCVFLEAQEAARRPLPCGRVELTVRVSAVYLAQNAAQGAAKAPSGCHHWHVLPALGLLRRRFDRVRRLYYDKAI